MQDEHAWIEELPAAVTVTDADGVIVAMNARSRATYENDGGGALVGHEVFACHPAAARRKVEALFGGEATNHYTISKRGVKKIIHQLPWYRGGVFAGYVEISVPIPQEMPHFDRDAKG